MDPALYFSQIESGCKLRGITSQKKKKISLGSLKTRKSVMELFPSPMMKAYNRLSDKLIVSISQWKKLSHLLRKETVGDSKPWQFLSHLKS